MAAPYDYSQPVVVNNYAAADDPNAAPAQVAQQTSDSDQATSLFDAGLAQFKAGDYQGALGNFDTALQKLPNDPVVHEVRALALFALGEYKPAAAALNSLLSSAPGMDWTTMSSLYGNTDDYMAQLHKLEQYCRDHQTDPASAFVLAYHDLVLDHKESAIHALQAVVKNQPQDSTAKRMLDALSPQQSPTPGPAAPGEDAPQTDLVGNWRANAGDSTINLAITDDSQFTWTALQPGKPAVELKGQLESSSDELSLESKDQGAMSGSVKSDGPDKWQFALTGAPPSAPGLNFERVKK
jgi:tetratricopeptide (TPR) repeat protein